VSAPFGTRASQAKAIRRAPHFGAISTGSHQSYSAQLRCATTNDSAYVTAQATHQQLETYPDGVGLPMSAPITPGGNGAKPGLKVLSVGGYHDLAHRPSQDREERKTSPGSRRRNPEHHESRFYNGGQPDDRFDETSRVARRPTCAASTKARCNEEGMNRRQPNMNSKTETLELNTRDAAGHRPPLHARLPRSEGGSGPMRTRGGCRGRAPIGVGALTHGRPARHRGKASCGRVSMRPMSSTAGSITAGSGPRPANLGMIARQLRSHRTRAERNGFSRQLRRREALALKGRGSVDALIRPRCCSRQRKTRLDPLCVSRQGVSTAMARGWVRRDPRDTFHAASTDCVRPAPSSSTPAGATGRSRADKMVRGPDPSTLDAGSKHLADMKRKAAAEHTAPTRRAARQWTRSAGGIWNGFIASFGAGV